MQGDWRGRRLSAQPSDARPLRLDSVAEVLAGLTSLIWNILATFLGPKSQLNFYPPWISTNSRCSQTNFLVTPSRPLSFRSSPPWFFPPSSHPQRSRPRPEISPTLPPDPHPRLTQAPPLPRLTRTPTPRSRTGNAPPAAARAPTRPSVRPSTTATPTR